MKVTTTLEHWQHEPERDRIRLIPAVTSIEYNGQTIRIDDTFIRALQAAHQQIDRGDPYNPLNMYDWLESHTTTDSVMSQEDVDEPLTEHVSDPETIVVEIE